MLSDNLKEGLYSDDVRDEIIKEFAEEFISLHPEMKIKTEDCVKALIETLNEVKVSIDEFAVAFLTAHREMQQIIQSYPNRRVSHLASHGRTERIRKKNTNRIFREIEKKVN